VLLEREREVRVLERALDRAAEGAGSIVLVEGPAGIGKTSLLAEARGLASARGLLVRGARGGQLERKMPFGIARQLFEPLVEAASAAERATLFAGSAGLALIALGRADPGDAGAESDPFAPIHGLYWLLANLAESRPVLVAIDDGHWADAQTLRFVDYLARRLSEIPACVVVAARSGEPEEAPELEPLRLEAEVVRPAPLSQGAVDELIYAELGGEPAPEFSDACTAATGGNPFLLTEVLRTLRADGLGPGAAAATIAELGPERVARYVLVRLGRFGDHAISLANAIAVLGRCPQLRHAATLAGLDEHRAATLCDRLRKAEILAQGVPIEFVHPLLRTAIYHELGEQQRSAAHRRAADLLSSTGVDAPEIAPHLLACAPNGDQWVVARLREAAQDASNAGAPDAAKNYLERALKEPPGDDLPLRYELGKALRGADPARAPEVLASVVRDTSDGMLRIRALMDAAGANLDIGNLDQALHWQAELVRSVPESDRERRLHFEALLFCIRSICAGRDSASSRRIRNAASGATGESRGECFVRQAVSFDRFLACDRVDEVKELADSFPPPPMDPIDTLPYFACKVLAWSGSWAKARDAAARLRESAAAGGLLLDVSHCSSFLSDIDRHAGRLADAEVEARTALGIVADLAPVSLPAFGAATNLVAALIARGELDEAARLAESTPLEANLSEVPMIPVPLEIRGILRLVQGALEEGVADLLALGEDAESRGFLNPAAIPWRQEVAPALATLGRAAEARGVIAVAEERARAFGAAHVIGMVLRSRALLEPRKRAIETLRESVAMLEPYGPPHELARSLVELGAGLRRDGQRADSREPLRCALELAHRCGAGGLEQRAREELAAAGSRPRSVFRTGVASLTASELRTARLAAEGRSNVEIAQRLFVTRKTVEKHLSNAYTKLEIASRDQLAGALDAPAADQRARTIGSLPRS
jgi:DNA-binding CsgD family transcriptional regulator